MGLTPHQLAKRKTYIGASEIAGVCNMSRWASPHSVYVDKKGLRERRESIRFDVGHQLEPTIAKWFCQRMGIDRTDLKPSRFVRHPQEKHIGATLDRRWPSCPDGAAIVQLKSVEVYAAADFGESGTDEVKPEYLLQVLHEMYAAQVPVGYLAVLIGFNDFRIYQFTWTDANKAIWLAALQAARTWWVDHYLADDPPALTGKDVELEYLQECRRNGIPTGEIRDKHPEVEKLLHGDPDAPANSLARFPISQIEVMAETATEELNRRKNGIRFVIGDADGIKTSRGVWTNAPDRRGVRTLRHHPIKLPGRAVS